MEAEREKKIEEYFIENVKKEQIVMISKARKLQKVLNQKQHEGEFLGMVQEHKQEIQQENNQKTSSKKKI